MVIFLFKSNFWADSYVEKGDGRNDHSVTLALSAAAGFSSSKNNENPQTRWWGWKVFAITATKSKQHASSFQNM